MTINRQCKQCRKPIPEGRHHNAVYCSRDCRRERENIVRRTGKPRNPKSPVKIHFETLLKESIPDAAAFLKRVMLDENETTKNRLIAAKELFDRAIGKPRQQMDHQITLPDSQVSVDWVKPAIPHEP